MSFSTLTGDSIMGIMRRRNKSGGGDRVGVEKKILTSYSQWLPELSLSVQQ